jgi:hypothetical protein
MNGIVTTISCNWLCDLMLSAILSTLSGRRARSRSDPTTIAFKVIIMPSAMLIPSTSSEGYTHIDLLTEQGHQLDSRVDNRQRDRAGLDVGYHGADIAGVRNVAVVIADDDHRLPGLRESPM